MTIRPPSAAAVGTDAGAARIHGQAIRRVIRRVVPANNGAAV